MASADLPLLDNETIEFGDDNDNRRATGLIHPYVTFFHVLFRSASLVVYLLCGVFKTGFITSFVIIVILLSMDFWTVKNISGRLMVGLRWWNYIDEDGKSHWMFESGKGQIQRRISERESSIFWTALILAPILWSVFLIVALFGFELQWMLLVIIALILNAANLYGYIKCKVGTNQSIKSTTTDFFRRQILQNAVSLVASQAAAPQPAGAHSVPI